MRVRGDCMRTAVSPSARSAPNTPSGRRRCMCCTWRATRPGDPCRNSTDCPPDRGRCNRGTCCQENRVDHRGPAHLRPVPGRNARPHPPPRRRPSPGQMAAVQLVGQIRLNQNPSVANAKTGGAHRARLITFEFIDVQSERRGQERQGSPHIPVRQRRIDIHGLQRLPPMRRWETLVRRGARLESVMAVMLSATIQPKRRPGHRRVRRAGAGAGRTAQPRPPARVRPGTVRSGRRASGRVRRGEHGSPPG